jgi:hypothetical protein
VLLVDFVGSSGAVFLASSTIEDFGGRGFWKKFMVLTNIAETKIYIFTTGGSTGAAVAASTIFLDLSAFALAAAASAIFLV